MQPTRSGARSACLSWTIPRWKSDGRPPRRRSRSTGKARREFTSARFRSRGETAPWRSAARARSWNGRPRCAASTRPRRSTNSPSAVTCLLISSPSSPVRSTPCMNARRDGTGKRRSARLSPISTRTSRPLPQGPTSSIPSARRTSTVSPARRSRRSARCCFRAARKAMCAAATAICTCATSSRSMANPSRLTPLNSTRRSRPATFSMTWPSRSWTFGSAI